MARFDASLTRPTARFAAWLMVAVMLCAWLVPQRVRADDFDDDFGALPRAPAPSTPPVASSEASDLEGVSGSAAATPYPLLDDDPVSAPLPALDPRRRLRTFVHPTVEGLVGGLHVIDATSAWPGTFRVALNAGFFKKNGFIEHGDHHRTGSGVLVLNLTPIEHVELAATVSTSSTQNRALEPNVVQVVGDAHLFAKGFYSIAPWLTLAGDAELALLNGVGSIGPAGHATSVGLRSSATADLRALEQHPLPLIVRSNLRYLFDNSGRLGRNVERDRYSSLGSMAPRADEYRQLLSPAERNALQVNRVDRIGASIGVELPLLPRERFNVNPLLEWTFALPVNRQGFDCVTTNIPGQRDSCLAKTGFGARPSTLSIGARVQPWVRGLGVLAAVDVATSGSRTFVRELAPLERYMIRLGISYAYDLRATTPPRPRIVRVEIPAAQLRGHIVGQVVESQTGVPIAGAIVHFEATSLSDVISDESGAFKSAELPPGAHGMRVSADGFREALCVAVLASSGADVAARCELTASAYFGKLHGHVTNQSGRALAGAHIALHGPGELSLTSEKDGSFRTDKLLEGTYDLTAISPGYFNREASLTITRGAEATPSIVFLARPPQSLVRMTPTRIVLARPIEFVDDSAIIAEQSLPMLGEVAELLQKHPQLTQLEIAGHLDDAGGAAAALALSQQRADAVRAWLINANIASERLLAKGYGATRPVVPNITARNRARNRRIDLLFR